MILILKEDLRIHRSSFSLILKILLVFHISFCYNFYVFKHFSDKKYLFIHQAAFKGGKVRCSIDQEVSVLR